MKQTELRWFTARVGKYGLSISYLDTFNVPFWSIRSVPDNHYIYCHLENILFVWFLKNFLERANLFGLPSFLSNKRFRKVCNLNNSRINSPLTYCDNRKQCQSISKQIPALVHPNKTAVNQQFSSEHDCWCWAHEGKAYSWAIGIYHHPLWAATIQDPGVGKSKSTSIRKALCGLRWLIWPLWALVSSSVKCRSYWVRW